MLGITLDPIILHTTIATILIAVPFHVSPTAFCTVAEKPLKIVNLQGPYQALPYNIDGQLESVLFAGNN